MDQLWDWVIGGLLVGVIVSLIVAILQRKTDKADRLNEEQYKRNLLIKGLVKELHELQDLINHTPEHFIIMGFSFDTFDSYSSDLTPLGEYSLAYRGLYKNLKLFVAERHLYKDDFVALQTSLAHLLQNKIDELDALRHKDIEKMKRDQFIFLRSGVAKTESDGLRLHSDNKN